MNSYPLTANRRAFLKFGAANFSILHRSLSPLIRHTRVEVFLPGIQARRQNQPRTLAVVKINIPLSGSGRSLGNEGHESAVGTEGRRLFMCYRVEPRQVDQTAAAVVIKINVLSRWALPGRSGNERQKASVGTQRRIDLAMLRIHVVQAHQGCRLSIVEPDVRQAAVGPTSAAGPIRDERQQAAVPAEGDFAFVVLGVQTWYFEELCGRHVEELHIPATRGTRLSASTKR